ncbi:MAG: VOC family protein [Chloroflexota bacterium]
MRIVLASVFVDDQDKALKFYTEVLGFVKKDDIAAGQYRWLTVVSPEAPDSTQLVLEPNDNPVAKTYQQGVFEQGIPATAFIVDDLAQEYVRLKQLGVRFTMEPTRSAGGFDAVFDDTCGNLIGLHQI